MLTYPPPPTIGPLAETGPRPFWSVMIPTYNRTAFLEKALNSVLSQDPGASEMQIEVIDNASTLDDPEPLVRRIGGDRVSFVRHPHNIGMLSNFNSCLERSRGEWVHILPSDDAVFPGFYARLRTALEGRVDIAAAFCRNATIDENDCWLSTGELENPEAGILLGFIEKIGIFQRIQCPAMVVRRSVYAKLGGFRLDLPYTADWEMWIRIAAHYPVWYEPTTLAAWRKHSKSATAAFEASGEAVIDERRCIEVSRSSLPPDRAEAISQKAREWVSFTVFSYLNTLSMTSQDDAILRLVEDLINVSNSGPIRRSWLPPNRATAIEQSETELLYLHALSKISRDDAALRLIEELIKLSILWPIHRSPIANALLRGADIRYRQGRRFQALVYVGRAILTRPIVAGRPIKRLIERLSAVLTEKKDTNGAGAD